MNDARTKNTIARERFLDAILQSAIEYAIISLDLDGLITSWNEGATRIFGWMAEEIIGSPISIIFTDDDKREGIPQREMTASLDRESGNDERWHRRGDGTLFWASGQMMALRSEDGIVEGFLKILRDRTDQREAEERQRMLMHELSHRMKNTLTVVQAITSQSFRSAATLEDAKSAITARLTAYSKAHDILLQRDWVSTTMASIVEATAANIGVEASERLRMHGPSVELGPQAALTFALVLHELATNASKYGALSGEAGTVDVSWDIKDKDRPIRLQFWWRESGGPEVRPPKRKGFGSRLIASSLRAFGHVTLDYRPAGVVVEIEADLGKLQYETCAEAEKD
ncbi:MULTISPECIES: sensor histidine kinase [unclassified Sinorhizobium]|uniref:sensor histidine kinase n=1 Tax=unclassified Sinorhizobium TaxID=2613772 RepID=UPI00352622D0